MTDRILASFRRLFLALCGCLIFSGQAAQPKPAPPSFAVAAPASWVWPVALAAEAPLPKDPDSGGISYLLIDQQQSVAPRASFYHEGRLITSETGVQNGAALTVIFDPSYQKLVFHFIWLIRDGTAADRLDRSQIEVLQRERDLESFLYDGTFSAHCRIEDVRVGDVIEYAYTIEGANPILKDRYFGGFLTEWSVPVRRAVTRIVRPSTRTLHFLIKNRAINPAISTRNDVTEWLWDEAEIAGRNMDANTPAGYNPYGTVQISEFAEWGEVVDWAIPLYAVNGKLSPELDAEIARVRALPGAEARILAALRFVQKEVRYLGLESGVGSHQPTPPGEVLRRRFGDCKDKTLLLATMLRECGLAATPALVSSVHRQQVAERLPSPWAFNHVILRVEAGKDIWWLDATRSFQSGPLSQIYSGNFGYALVLRPGERELTAFAPSPDAMPKKKIVEKYSVPAPGGDGWLEVTSEFRGLAADLTRAYFQSTSRDDIQKAYLQYYARRFPRIRSAGRFDFRELPGETGCEVRESYIIPGLWQLDEEKAQHTLALFPSDVDNESGTPGAAQRNDPLALAHPVHITQEMHADMFENWTITPSQKEITNAFFHFQHDSKISGRHIQVSYSYRSLLDRIPVAELADYDAAQRKLKATLGYSFTYSTPEQLTALRQKDPHSGHGQFNWPIALMLAVIVLAAIAGCVFYHRATRRASPLPPALTHPSLEGLGGWLILVGFGIVIRPLTLLFETVKIFPSIFQMETWRALTVSGQPAYHPFWLPTLLFELIYNALAIVLCFLVAVQFFQKRAVWPRCFAWMFIFFLLALVVDTCLVAQIPAAASSLQNSAREIGRVIVGSLVWIPYVLVSKRVKATFRY